MGSSNSDSYIFEKVLQTDVLSNGELVTDFKEIKLNLPDLHQFKSNYKEIMDIDFQKLPPPIALNDINIDGKNDLKDKNGKPIDLIDKNDNNISGINRRSCIDTGIEKACIDTEIEKACIDTGIDKGCINSQNGGNKAAPISPPHEPINSECDEYSRNES